MTRLLFVEDEKDFRDSFGPTLKKHRNGVEITDIEGFALKSNGGPVETQFSTYLLSLGKAGQPLSGALLDTDLSTNRENVSQSVAMQALRSLGIPTCRYSKKQDIGPTERLRALKVRMTEGAYAVPFTYELNLASDPDTGATWLLSLFDSFAKLSEAIQASAKNNGSPASILANALGNPDAEVDFASYREAYPYYFADLLEEHAASDNKFDQRQLTQLSYWFANCILAFPGPLLNVGATAAVLGFESNESILSDDVRQLIASCQYEGPFSSQGPFYWRSKLLDKLDDKSTADALVEIYKKNGIQGPLRSLRYCLVQNKPIPADQSPSRPDWIPAGAIESYVERNLYLRLNPWIKPTGAQHGN